ncbi:uncharacterized protein [Gossypium hirsutum]|uniref:Uncharacterized protein n=1 Tax=Gossypium hirsutum TaxID=3635 RepID=A0A1U8N944_GOSHI|nr:uncharacterized protein LOC107945834 [Gossypium hirsutum]
MRGVNRCVGSRRHYRAGPCGSSRACVCRVDAGKWVASRYVEQASQSAGAGVQKMETPTNSINSQSEALVQTQSSIQNSVLLVAAAVSHNEKPTKFSGQNLKTWQQKMLFYLTMLNLAKLLKDDPPTVKEGKIDEVTTFTAVEAWKYSDFLCRSYILNRLSDALYEFVNQVQELELIIHEILAEGMIISESFQVVAIIEKLPPAWNDSRIT